MPLSSDLREFIECLNSNEDEYLVVGALAVSWHGFPRYSGDIDFPIRQANAVRVMRVLAQCGFGSLDISASDLTLTGKAIQLGYEPNRIDLMTSITGVSRMHGKTALPATWMAYPSTSSADRLSSVIRTPRAAPRTASTRRNSGSRNRRPESPAGDGRDVGAIRRRRHRAPRRSSKTGPLPQQRNTIGCSALAFWAPIIRLWFRP